MRFFGLYIDVSVELLLFIIGISLVVWFVGVWFSFRRSGKNILLKSLLFLCAILSVDALVLQPQYEEKQTPSTAILFTNQIDAEYFKPGLENYTYFKLPAVKSSPADTSLIKTVANLAHLALHYQPIDSVIVVGDNLTFSALKNPPFVPIRFVQTKVGNANSLIEIRHSESIRINEDFEFFLKLNVDSSIQKYVIQSPFSKLDTILINKNLIEIDYQATCSIPGDHLVEIYFLDTLNAVIESFAFPVEVIPNQKATILMLNGHPDFEHKHLKNWIARQGHQLSVRTQVSLQNFQYDQINQEKKNVAFALDDRFLKQVDLLIIDASALLSLTENEYQLIKQYHKKGMAFLIRTDEAIINAKDKWRDFEFSIKPIAQSQRVFAEILIDKQIQEIEISPFENSLFTSKQFKGKDAGKILSINRKANKLLGITNLQNSYLFNLKGDTAIYNTLWYGIVNEMLGNKNIIENSWEFKQAHPQTNEAVDVVLLSNETSPKAFVKTLEASENEWSPLYLQQNYLIDEKYEATFWANQSGWYQFKTEQDNNPTNLFIANKQQNKLIRAYNKNLLKAKYISQIKKRDGSTYKAEIIYSQKLMSPIWNWLIFVICLSFIWILEKFIEQ